MREASGMPPDWGSFPGAASVNTDRISIGVTDWPCTICTDWTEGYPATAFVLKGDKVLYGDKAPEGLQDGLIKGLAAGLPSGDGLGLLDLCGTTGDEGLQESMTAGDGGRTCGTQRNGMADVVTQGVVTSLRLGLSS